MTGIDILIIIFAITIIGFTIYKSIKEKKRGCSFNCSTCPYASKCESLKELDKNIIDEN